MLERLSIMQRDEINRLSLHLRTAYYDTHKNEHEVYSTPYGGVMTESIGAWPEFILRGTFCKRSSKGLCSPCFYSRFPLSKSSRSEYQNMLKEQVLYVVSNFKSLVVNKQYGEPNVVADISLVLTPTGSFFDDHEFPLEIRLEMEKSLVNAAHEYGVNIFLHIESHCEDFLEFDPEEENHKKELDLLRKLHARVVFGFESVDEYARNVLYNKKLELSDFENAVTKASNVGLTPGAFVFAGLFAFNDLQTHDDVVSTVKYLVDKSVFPVIMFQNDQPYTITDLLLKIGKITLLEPFTVAWIVADVLGILENSNSYWLIADPIGGPPEPDCHIFKTPKMTPKPLSDAIYSALVKLRKTRNMREFTAFFKDLQQSISFSAYNKRIQSLTNGLQSAQTNTETLLYMCRNNIKQYSGLSRR